MIGHRTCIICLPRSGSQLCEILIAEVKANNTRGRRRLGEYFENWNGSEYILIDNNFLFQTSFKAVKSPLQIAENFEERINLLKQVNPDQPFVMRLFLMDNYDKLTLAKIILELKNLNFEFVTLFRDVEDQILSYMLAQTYKVSKNEDVFAINRPIADPVNIDINLLANPVDYIYNSSLNWEANLNNLLTGINYQTINYNTIYSDLEKIYNIKFKYLGNKSIKGNPLDLILNKEEVLGFLLNRYSGLRSSSRFTNSAAYAIIT